MPKEQQDRSYKVQTKEASKMLKEGPVVGEDLGEELETQREGRALRGHCHAGPDELPHQLRWPRTGTGRAVAWENTQEYGRVLLPSAQFSLFSGFAIIDRHSFYNLKCK